MKELKDKKLIFGIGIAFLFLATIGLSYAYFTATLVNKDVKDQIVTTGTLSLKYTDGPEINAKNIKPGWTLSKTVTIENTGTLDAIYTIYWKELLNEITNDELVMNLECESSTDTCSIIDKENQPIDIEKSTISENIFISPGEIQTITLNFEFKELNKDQNYNQNKKFSGVINIKDSSSIATQKEYTMYARVIDQNDNPIANKTIELQTSNKTGTTNEKGYVKIQGLKQGSHELIVKDGNDILDTKKISISRKKESDVIDNSIIYADSNLDEFTVTIILNDNKIEKINNLIIPPDECFTVTNNILYDYNEEDICPKELIVPNKVGENTITQISNKNYSTLESNGHPFTEKGIRKVVIPEGITMIGYLAFARNKLTSITLPNSTEIIGGEAFSGNELTNIIIPNGVKEINSRAFAGNKLKELIVPSSVTYIGVYSFYNNKLTSITIPESVTNIEWSAFNNNELPDSQAFIYKRNSDGTENKTTILSYGGINKNVIIPDGVTTLGRSTFENSDLTSITIPDSVVSIEYEAFYNNQLTSVTIPDSVTTIGSNAFKNNQLTSLTIPSSVTTIESSTFENNKLTSLTIPESVKYIESDAFNNNQLTSITIPESVTTIGSDAFNNNQLTSLTIPESVTTIGSNAFKNNKLTSLTIPSSVTSIGIQAFNNNELPDSQAFIYKRNSDGTENKTTILSYGGINKNVIIPNGVTTIRRSTFENSDLTSATIPDSVVSIEYEAFKNNKLTSITIPKSVTNIGWSVFANNKLTSVIIPDSVTQIGDYAFSYNELTSVTIPNSVTSIGYGAFGDNNLQSITIPKSVTNIGSSAFNNNKLPDSQAFIYERNTDGSEDKTTIVSYGGKNKDIVIPDGVTTIGDSAFSHNNLTSVTIPENVTSIDGYAFWENNLKQVTIKGKTSSSEFETYLPNWGWASDATCVKDNTSNVPNGCIIWNAN